MGSDASPDQAAGRHHRPAVAAPAPERGAEGDGPGEPPTSLGRLERRRGPRAPEAGLDPHVAELSGRVAALGEALRSDGEAALRVEPGMDRFDATLRAYCVGYLASRRRGDAP